MSHLSFRYVFGFTWPRNKLVESQYGNCVKRERYWGWPVSISSGYGESHRANRRIAALLCVLRLVVCVPWRRRVWDLCGFTVEFSSAAGLTTVGMKIFSNPSLINLISVRIFYFHFCVVSRARFADG